MSDGTRAVFSALDNAKTQLYHFKAIFIAGKGFFTDAYDLFCITAVTKLSGRLYYFDPVKGAPVKLPTNINNAITGVALCGTLAGKLFFGWLGDKLATSVVGSLCFFRFWRGFGIGGDYPLSAVIMSEYANQKTRGAFIAAVFAMQGVGIMFAGAVSTIVSMSFLSAFPAPPFSKANVIPTQPETDFDWRIVLMFGAIPAALTYYWRMKMPETARYTALVEGNHKKAAKDMAKVLEKDITIDEATSKAPVNPKSSYRLFSQEFLRNHGAQLLGTASTWFLLDIAFYSLNLTQKEVYLSAGSINKASSMKAIEEVYHLSKAMSLIALVAIVPGYWFTVFLVDKIRRFIIQLGGFLLMSILMAILGFKYGYLRGEEEFCGAYSEKDFCGGHPIMFTVIYGLTFFFANFGPNSTTFIVPAELFPARFRSTCHGISAASGKAGAIIGAFVVQYYTQDGDSDGIKKAILVFLW
ncbi:hypothetical protein POTOM_059814 [Populus tomentosa]|uniref:Major facilitator superfamily (MFS) profile domain-containing protein n=1 Tax=Populus tomentosa TaxID=118781 RepID=A0A8X7XNE6_POPTO|nr:hypothetical protein POTOM_059814 [Populus tomentosa]